MKINSYGQVEITAEEAFQSLYSGKINNLKNVYVEGEDRTRFNQARDLNGDRFPELETLVLPNITLEEFDKLNQQNWFMPKEYYDFEIVGYLLDKTTNEEEYQRVVTELEIFAQHNMIDLLRYIKYLVDTMRKNNIVWGVGRGSSVASYVLYLIGVHKVNSIKYELDIKEFLK
jgi:DNA polymerase III alpha subunit